MRTICMALILATVGGSSAAHANDWLKADLYANAVTGNITVYSNEIKFQNGARISIVPAGQTHTTIFQINPPSNPKLNNGRNLCAQMSPNGSLAPTYVAYGELEARPGLSWSKLLYVKIFAGPEVPPATVVNDPSSNDPGFCGLFWYMLPLAGGGSPARVGEWFGADTATMSSTPKMRVTSPSYIEFPEGSGKIHIVPVGPDHPGIYRVDPPANPKTSPNYNLCDARGLGSLATYVAFLERPDDMEPDSPSPNLYFKVFTGSTVPPATVVRDPDSQDSGICGGGHFGIDLGP